MRNYRRWTGLFALAAVAALIALGGTSSAQQTGNDKAFERQLDTGLRDVINLGATIFNNQDDHAGCYRLFEGALKATRPLLGNYPALQKRIDTGFAEANKAPRMHDRAHALRKVLDEIRATLNPSAIPVAKSLWDRMGGEKGVGKALGDFITAAATDPKVDFTRGGKFLTTAQQAQALHKSLLDFVSSATGGPYKYNGRNMKTAHAGMGITNEQFDALAGHLKTALERNGVTPDDVNAVLGAIAGTRGDIVEAPNKKVDVVPPPIDPKLPLPDPIKKFDDIPPAKKAATLWDKLGGEKGVSKVLSEFLQSTATDPNVDFQRGGKFITTQPQAQALLKSLLDFVSEATGGPFKYTGPSMKQVHLGMGITNEQFDALAGHLKIALEKNGVGPDEVSAVLGAVGGTRADIVEPKKLEDKSIVPPLPDPIKKGDPIPPLPDPIKKLDDKLPPLPDPIKKFDDIPPAKKAATLWDKLGGEKNVTKVLADFMNAAGPDPAVDFTRGGKFITTQAQAQALLKSLVDLVSDVTGGPYKYTGRNMKDTHRGMGITNEQFDALASHLKRTLELNGAASDDINAVLSVIAGTRADIVEQPAIKKDVLDVPPPPLPLPDKKGPLTDPNLARVQGTVTINGLPLTHGFVTFVNAANQHFSANIKADGRFGFQKGFPAGDYAVLLEETSSPPLPGEMRLPIPPDYTNLARSPLRFTAAQGPSTFNITAK